MAKKSEKSNDPFPIKLCYKRMYGRTNGWTYGCIDGQTDGHMDVWTDKRMDIWTDGRGDRQTDGKTIKFRTTKQNLSFIIK